MDYSLSEIARICSGRLAGRDCRVGSVVTDSRRSFGPDSHPLFVALCGAGRDGHRYVDELYRRGVRAFMVSRPFEPARYPQAGFVVADDTVRALQDWAADYRGRFRGTVAAIAGSCGKTIVKEWAAALAPATLGLFRSPRSYNSQIGVPLSLLMMRGDEDAAVVEAGISRPGEMARLAAVVRPDIGVFTALGPQHAENFASDEEKLREKLALFESCRTIIYDGADRRVADAVEERFPAARLVDVSRAVDRTPSPGEGVRARAAAGTAGRKATEAGEPAGFLCGPGERGGGRFPDRAMRADAALAAALLVELGCERAAVEAATARLRPLETRLHETEGLYGSHILRDRYDCDAQSLPLALDELRAAAGNRPATLVLADEPEPPSRPAGFYTALAQAVERAGIDCFVGVGADISAAAARFPAGARFYPTASAMLAGADRERLRGRTIMVKGSSADADRIAARLSRGTHTTVMEIDLEALASNLRYYRTAVGPQRRLMAMVKASAYGHGGPETAAALCRQGIDYLAVAFADEGAALREAGISAPVVVLNADADSFGAMIASELEPEIYSFESLERFADEVRARGATGYPIHIKLDTGMHRLGFGPDDTARLADRLAGLEGTLTVRSIFSHLAAADDSAADDFTLGQIARFEAESRRIADGLPYAPLRHLAGSAAAVRFPQARYDMCRLGIGLYGFGWNAAEPVRPVARLLTRIVQLRELPAGETVGYGRAQTLVRPSRIATIPVGYADGLDRRLGCGRWRMLAGGCEAPTVGRICMDSCMIDVTDAAAAVGDTVEVFGPQAGHTAADMARALDTIPYEILTSVAPRVRRIYVKD